MKQQRNHYRAEEKTEISLEAISYQLRPSKKRNAPNERQKRECCGSPQLAIIVSTRSWRGISWWKTQQTKNSLNFASTCLKVVDTRRSVSTKSSCSLSALVIITRFINEVIL
jgi:hypothetical protein